MHCMIIGMIGMIGTETLHKDMELLWKTQFLFVLELGFTWCVLGMSRICAGCVQCCPIVQSI